MISIDEAQLLIEKFINLRTKAQETKSVKDKIAFQKHEKVCIEKFMYLVYMRTARYKKFSNYEDLNQEGVEALVKSMKNYDLKKGNFFWWSHKYIATRISRSANLHTTIRYPLKIARKTTPHREAMPTMVELIHCPDKEVEDSQIANAIHTVSKMLPDEQRHIINLAFGCDGEKPMSINKICGKLNVSRTSCIKIINNALAAMKDNIKL